MEKIRVSAGSAAVLGLHDIRMKHVPTTIHLLQYSESGCNANCGFCPQARDVSREKSWLSRVSWPAYSWVDVKDALVRGYKQGNFARTCLQTVVYPGFIDDLHFLARDLLGTCKMPLSVAITPLPEKDLVALKEAGVERVGIALDAPTPDSFSRLKGKDAGGPFTWEGHWAAIRAAINIFGSRRVTTHLIVGNRDSERDIVEFLFKVKAAGISVGLFAFMPIKGTALENEKQPDVSRFRRIQLARYLILEGLVDEKSFTFDDEGRISGWGMSRQEITRLVNEKRGSMFRTTGCPGCNRPYYTSSPRGTMYNYPSPLDADELETAMKQLFEQRSDPGRVGNVAARSR